MAKRDGAGHRWRWPLGLYTTPVLLIVLWQLLSMAGAMPTQFAPAPHEVLNAGWDLYRSGELLPSLGISLQRAGLGLALGLAVGISAGLLGGFLRSGEYIFNGVFQIFNTLPMLALLPLMLVWFGIGELTKVLLIAFAAMVPMYVNLFAAIRGIDQRLVEMARTNDVSMFRMLRQVILPGSLPGLLVGLRFAMAYSVLGLVAAELVNADAGIGYLVTRAQTFLQIDQLFFGMMIYAMLGLLADQFVRLLERILLMWRPSYEAR
ncbi:ABC transporter permease [Rhodococcus opacus]|uniref:ABC transporter permease n=1 Tax=Rhodococcus opacus TaxID=37919 RepID=UPI001F546DEF|nr:ABC transporter permease [Rhodococcus opacus]